MKLRWAIFKCNLRSLKFKVYRFWRCILGYIDISGAPKKCPHCKCKHLETYETFRHDQGFIEEYWVRCTKCKEQVGVWAYGYWQN